MGGPSREHDVSIKTGKAVFDNLSKIYSKHKVVVSLDGKWSLDDGPVKSIVQGVIELKKLNIDIVFIALHGSFGEDGTIQALFEKHKIAYTGSNSASSLMAMDKIISSELFESYNIATPKSTTFTRFDLVKGKNIGTLNIKYPIIVKPASQGSSIGVTLVESKDDLLQAIEYALEHDNKIIIQEYIKGREVSCGVLEIPISNELISMLPTELKPNNADFFDYYAKYTPGATDEITPPPNMSKDTIEKIQKIAINAHNILGCSGYSRTDMFVTDNEIFAIETNTLPGLTEESILPRQAFASGIDFTELLDKIIANGLSRQLV